MNDEAVNKIAELALKGIKVENTANAAIIMHKDYAVKSLESLQTHRYRFRGIMDTSSVKNFMRYCHDTIKGNTNPTAACFVSGAGMQAKTIFDLGNSTAPGHCQHSAKLKLEKTAPYQQLLKISGERLLQKGAAEFMEDWIDYLEVFSDSASLPVKSAIQAIRKITVDSKSSVESNTADFSESRSVMESVEARNAPAIPSLIHFTCTPYEGLPERTFALRLSLITSDDVPKFVMRLINAERHTEEMAQQLVDIIDKELGAEMPVYAGNFLTD